MTNTIIAFVFIILGIMAFIASWVTSRNKNSSVLRRTRSQPNTKNFQSISWFRRSFFKKTNRKYILAYSVLIVALLYQSHQPFRIAVINSFDSIFGEKVVAGDPCPYWPWSDNTLHPVVENMPRDIEDNGIESVAWYIAKEEPDPYLQIKALHDYVAARIFYDNEAVEMNTYQHHQDAQIVFKNHRAVCAGYSNLLVALGKAIGVNIKKIEGDIRKELASEEITPFVVPKNTRHAWNTLEIKGYSYLIDVTWDSSKIHQNNSYSADYLMIAPEALIKSHFPDLTRWQLLPNKVDKKVFEEQPLLEPMFFAHKLELISPKDYQTQVKEDAEIEIKNPQQSLLVAGFIKDKDMENQKVVLKPCEVKDKLDSITDITCHFPEDGNYRVKLFQDRDYLGELKYKSI